MYRWVAKPVDYEPVVLSSPISGTEDAWIEKYEHLDMNLYVYMHAHTDMSWTSYLMHIHGFNVSPGFSIASL